MLHWEERHRRLVARLMLVVLLSLVVDAIGTLLIWATESGVKAGDVHGIALVTLELKRSYVAVSEGIRQTIGNQQPEFIRPFFTTVQLLTVSSQIRNPLTAAGKVVDIGLELWAVIVVAGSAGAIAAFFQSGDS